MNERTMKRVSRRLKGMIVLWYDEAWYLKGISLSKGFMKDFGITKSGRDYKLPDYIASVFQRAMIKDSTKVFYHDDIYYRRQSYEKSGSLEAEG